MCTGTQIAQLLGQNCRIWENDESQAGGSTTMNKTAYTFAGILHVPDGNQGGVDIQEHQNRPCHKKKNHTSTVMSWNVMSCQERTWVPIECM